MNFKIISGELSQLEEKDVIKMLRIGDEIAFKNEHSYKVQDKHGDIKTIKVGTKADPKGYHYRTVKVLFNRMKKIVA
jgi:hypothetical protein